MNPLSDLRTTVEQAAAQLRNGAAAAGARPTLERPPRADFGDYSTNAAMLLAPALGAAPREIAARLGEELVAALGDAVERTEVAGPGFLNLFLSDSWHVGALANVLEAGEGFGGGGAGGNASRVLIEFVSANPTGPLTAAGGRHAAYGDALARLLAFAGHEVSREYYVNDAGSQVSRLGDSIRARARGEALPPEGYEGEYVSELAARIDDAADGDPAELARKGVALLLADIEQTLHRFGTDFDVWFSERSLQADDGAAITAGYEALKTGGHTYVSGDALWLRSSHFGDDKDRVLRRASGEDTYLGADVAYHQDKRSRGFGLLIDVWGADHHGYVKRMEAAWEALGGAPDAFEIVIMQFVNVIERGERSAMSKRRGDFVTLDELIDEIGVDAARFFMLQRSHDTTVDLDLDLARSQSNENPVYYVQYAHARICSVLEKAGESRVSAAVADVSGALGSGSMDALHPSERALVRKLLEFPREVEEACARRAPHRVAVYALELAQDYTAFYRDCHVVGAEPAAVESLRITLCVASRQTIATALGLLGVSAPSSM